MKNNENEVLASRGRAQGGNTSKENGSDLATPTASTVSAPLAAKLEAIAQSWDECICEGIGEDREIGAVLREQFAKIAAPSSTEGAQAAPEDSQTNAVRDVLAERKRQIEKEGWTPEHDDEHADDSMIMAAICYALPENLRGERPQDVIVGSRISRPYGVPTWWPEAWCATWWKPRDRRSNLVRAGALILADIERIDRAALRTSSTDQANADTGSAK